MTKCRKKHITLLVLLSLFVIIVLWALWGNFTVKSTEITIKDSELPQAFSGFKIAHVSDLHNAEFGDNNAKLIKILKEQKPDIIAITGYLVDSDHTDIEISIEFCRQAMEIAPCYYVPGNHEAWLGDRFNELENELLDIGVNVLRNESVSLSNREDTAWIMGVDDPDFVERSSMFDLSAGIISTEIQNTNAGEGYKILLSHRPEVFETYVQEDINLVLSGHAHGGQFRIPFVGGLVAPNQGFFPEYDSGLYCKENTKMVVSRGIGNSIIPVRINNRPELVFVTLQNL